MARRVHARTPNPMRITTDLHRAAEPRAGLRLADGLGLSRDRLTRARVGVIGAGAAGLAAAHALRAGGFTRVTLLERSDHVGGKCWSFDHDGRSYEMGAVALSSAYKSVRALMHEVGLRASPKLSGACFLDVDAHCARRLPPASRERPVRSLLALAALEAQILRHSRLRRPGFAGADRALFVPFADWLRAHELELAARFIAPWITPLGYGYIDEIPAVYVLKYLPLIRFPLCEIDVGGFQEVWRRVADGLDVRLGVDVRAVTRGDVVTVETSRGAFELDALILACPLDEALGFLDASDDERRLFSMIRYERYHVLAAMTEGLPDARWTHFPGHCSPDHAGWPVFMLRRWRGSGLRTFYTLAKPNEDMDVSEARMRETVDRLGGKVTGVLRRHAWRYFPHVASADLAGGFYEALEGMQGQRSTYYAGELLSFATVEHVTAHARDLVSRWFLDHRVRRDPRA
jgi:hypothetical protein